jgi:beta-lactamase superfamily II metal-dependent hydrolase
MHRLLWFMAPVVSLCVALVPASSAAQSVDALTVRFMDVGRGDATWITTPDNRTVLVDCGGAQFGPRLVVQLQTWGAGRISQLAVSQPGPDLVSGCVDVLSALPVDQVLWNGHQDTSTAWQAFWSLLPTPATPVKLGDVFLWGLSPSQGPATATVYNPIDANSPRSDPTDDGLAVLIEYAGHRTLVVGQISQAAAELVAASLPGKIDVLKVGSGGQGGGSSLALLTAAQPNYVVLSYAPQNPPDKDTLNRLTSTGAQLLTTADHGTLTFSMTQNMPAPAFER